MRDESLFPPEFLRFQSNETAIRSFLADRLRIAADSDDADRAARIAFRALPYEERDAFQAEWIVFLSTLAE